MPVGPAVFDRNVVVLKKANLAQALSERHQHFDTIRERPGAKDPDYWHYGLLRRRPERPAMTSRRLVCRGRSIVRGDGGRFTTPPPSRLEARSRLGDKATNELGAPVVSSIPAQLPGPEPASARKGREDDRAVLRWNRRVAGPA